MNAFALNPSLLAAYRRHEDGLIVQRLRVACVLCIIIVPLAASMDWVVYPEHVGPFLANRLICALSVGVLLWWLHRPDAMARARVSAQIWVNVMLAYNAFMIFYADGVMSPYYAGINLVVLGACLLIPWSFRENLAGCFASLAWYLAACLGNWWLRGGIGEKEVWFPVFFTNTFIMLSNVLICGTSGYFSAQLRFRDFQLQYELDQSRKALEESYSDLASNKRALEESCRKLEEMDRVKSDFFANISHELRTPLTLVLSPMDSMRTHPAVQTDPKLRETLDLMSENGFKLLGLINDLLDLVRLNDGRLELNFEVLDLRDFLPGMVSSVRQVAERAGLNLQLEVNGADPLLVRADKDRLEKIFLNLVFNAIKFTPESGAVRVQSFEQAGMVHIAVEDSGIGIAQENLPFVFRRFWQEDGSVTRVRQGTGIGLALVKELVELQGGKVSVKSQKGVGSTFTVQLPKSREPVKVAVREETPENWLDQLHRRAQYHFVPNKSTRTEPAAAKTAEGFKPTILVVEDEADMQRFLESELSPKYHVLIAGDGCSGWELAHKHQPKLILTDMMLPKMDGVTLCRQLRSSPSLLPTKIVLLTARADDRTKIAALEAGADDFLPKPFSTVELKTRLANLLLAGQLERELQNQNQVLEAALRQLRAAEAQLVQNARLSALGTLAAGIMHEINNPVNFMLTATHYLKTLLPADNEATQTTVADIQDGLERVRDIIADLKGFAYRGASVVKGECHPEKLWRTAKRLLASEIKDEVAFEVDIEKNSPFFANENQMVQLLVNFVQNSLQATLHNAEHGKKRLIKIRFAPESTFYTLSVWDNGKGIAEEDVARVFDPFFTTKDVGEGMGLGLSICYTIIKQHGGEICVNSELGKFTQITVRLPLHTPV